MKPRAREYCSSLDPTTRCQDLLIDTFCHAPHAPGNRKPRRIGDALCRSQYVIMRIAS